MQTNDMMCINKHTVAVYILPRYQQALIHYIMLTNVIPDLNSFLLKSNFSTSLYHCSVTSGPKRVQNVTMHFNSKYMYISI